VARLKRVRRTLPYIAAILGVLVLYRFTQPVLFHIPGDCVCSDYSDRVDGFTILNPIRNRAPERSADGFLADLRDGRTSNYATPQLVSEVRGPSAGARHLQWSLRYREDFGSKVLLYYGLDNTGAAHLPLEYGGEGMVEVDRVNGSWKADRFDVVW
jgi:hypothetical protein